LEIVLFVEGTVSKMMIRWQQDTFHTALMFGVIIVLVYKPAKGCPWICNMAHLSFSLPKPFLPVVTHFRWIAYKKRK